MKISSKPNLSEAKLIYKTSSRFSPMPKGYNSLHSGLTTAYDRPNHSKSALPYPRTHEYGAVQSDAPTREPPHTQSWFAAASPHGA